MALTLHRYEDSEGEPGDEEDDEEEDEEEDDEGDEEGDDEGKPAEGGSLAGRKGAAMAKEPLNVPSLTRLWF